MTKPTSPRYVTFYKVMLILSTIGTSLGVIGLASLPETIAEFSRSPIYGVAAILQVIILAVSIVALVLLWQKKLLGYQLKISTYIASIASTIISLFGVSEYSKFAAEQAIAESTEPLTESMTNLIYTATEVGAYVALVLAIGVSITFLFLWRAAWKRQAEEDGMNPPAHHKNHRS